LVAGRFDGDEAILSQLFWEYSHSTGTSCSLVTWAVVFLLTLLRYYCFGCLELKRMVTISVIVG
jgi:hypothetical protein